MTTGQQERQAQGSCQTNNLQDGLKDTFLQMNLFDEVIVTPKASTLQRPGVSETPVQKRMTLAETHLRASVSGFIFI